MHDLMHEIISPRTFKNRPNLVTLVLSELTIGHICIFFMVLVGPFQLDGANLQVQTHFVPQTMD